MVISACFTCADALCPTECQATEDLSDSDALLVEKRVDMRRRRLSAVFVLCLTLILSAKTFVSQGQSDCFYKMVLIVLIPYIKIIVSKIVVWTGGEINFFLQMIKLPNMGILCYVKLPFEHILEANIVLLLQYSFKITLATGYLFVKED